MSHVRWTVVALLFFAVTINYVDRAVIGVLKPVLDQALGWDQRDYGWMVTAFQAAYAIGYAVSGRLLDRFGIRLGFSVAVALWSLAAMAHGAMSTVLGFSVARAALGLAEGGTLPAAVKGVSEWFPREQRAFATGMFNAGSNVGAITCPVVVPWLAGRWGWQGAFVATGAIGFVWLAVWLWLYRAPDQHPLVNAEELAYIRKDPPEPPHPHLPWAALLGKPQTWAFMIGMMASSPVWWFYIFWVPDFLNKQFGLGLTQSSLPLVVIFTVASAGGVGGGWLSSKLLRAGWTVNAARKTALLACSACILPVFITPLVPVTHVWWAVAIVTLAAAAHCGYAANLFTLVSDTVPRQAVSSVVGIGGMAGSIAGMFFAQLVARVLYATHDNFVVPFAIAACTYSLALLAIHLLLPRLEPMTI
ncbi:Hexuronate transporter [Luteitalea pratensis]|uniref:Hexuronate transporter n=1 Tax=Luteitalea pratensis TaxID=1855912 RepID=A0A143PJJ7_LUTPR|nr:MFS transporter [Luteitalea pratensis]AMY08762.1 Hexuronate transporter [Luteitalea pratensis]